jgi:cbb3-type cytochrome oxidase maturation protein
MEVLFLLVPLSIVLVLLIMALFAWALKSGQLDDLEREGQRILQRDVPAVDADQAPK